MSSTILSRLSSTSFQSSTLSSTQSQVDGLVTGFVEEAANPRTLAAITAGGLAYRIGRMGTLALAVNTGERIAPVLRLGSYAVGLGSEVTAFEFTNRSLITLAGEHTGSPLQDASRLWSWSGPGGWREGLASSAITFGLLKCAGFLGREQNIVFQHAFQSTAMVAGHNAAGIFGIGERPQGTLAEQLLHAEATNIQLGAGSSVLHSIAPGIHALERGLDLSLRSQASEPLPSNLRNSSLQEVYASGPRGTSRPRKRSLADPFSNILQMSSNEGDGKGGGDSDEKTTIRARTTPARKSSLTNLFASVSGLPSREGMKEALRSISAALTGGFQQRVLNALADLESGKPVHPIIQGIVEDPRLQQAGFLSPEAKEEIKQRLKQLHEGEAARSSSPPAQVIGGRPSAVRFRLMLSELGTDPEETAKILNRVYAPLIDLARYPSFSGIGTIYISDSDDETKLNDYAKLSFQSLGELIFFGRKHLDLNWTLPEAARHLKMKPEELDAIERNERLPTEKELPRIARVLKLHYKTLGDLVEEGIRRFPALTQPGPSSDATVDPSDLDSTRTSTGEDPTAGDVRSPDDEKLQDIFIQRLRYYEGAIQKPVGTWPFSPEEAVTGVTRIARFLADRNRVLEQQIDRDEKTGALSMNGLNHLKPNLERRLLASNRRSTDEVQRSNWVLYLDIDDFKLINTRYGHLNADVVIKRVAQTMMETVRSRDYVVRSSQAGDEFIIYLSNSDQNGAERVAHDLLTSISAHIFSFPETKQPDFKVHVSIGAAVMRPLPNPEEGGEPIVEGSLEDAIRRANDSLHESKKKEGKGQLTISEK